MKCKGSICHEYRKRNIGTSEKRINKRVRVTSNLVEWSCTNNNNKLTIFRSNDRAQRMNKSNKEDHIFLSNDRVQTKEIYQ